MVLRELPDYYVIYERGVGSYAYLGRNWEYFLEKYQKYLTKETKFLERTYDDPAVTQKRHCLFDICMSVKKDCPLENTTTIQGGKYMVYPFKGHIKEIYKAYQTIFLEWLPRASYELDSSRSLFDVYHQVKKDRSSTEWKGKFYIEMEICVPVRG